MISKIAKMLTSCDDIRLVTLLIFDTLKQQKMIKIEPNNPICRLDIET